MNMCAFVLGFPSYRNEKQINSPNAPIMAHGTIHSFLFSSGAPESIDQEIASY